ncbi:MAG: hypothetical protein WC556_08865 [Candidatus Methanoperedens sp.]
MNTKRLRYLLISIIVFIGLAVSGSATTVSYNRSFSEKKMCVIDNLRIRASRLSSVIFIIFVGMVFTQIAVIIGGVR